MQFVLSFDRFGHFTDYKAGLRYCASCHQAREAALSIPDFRSPGKHTRIRPELSMYSCLGLRTDGGTHGEWQMLVRKVRETWPPSFTTRRARQDLSEA